MRTVTQAEWEAVHPDFKGVREDGTRYLLRFDPETGATISEPVRVEEPEETTDRAD